MNFALSAKINGIKEKDKGKSMHDACTYMLQFGIRQKAPVYLRQHLAVKKSNPYSLSCYQIVFV